MTELDKADHILKEYGGSYSSGHLRAYVGFINVHYRKALRLASEHGVDILSYMTGAIDGMKLLAYTVYQLPKEAEDIAICWDRITEGKSVTECIELNDKIAKDPYIFDKENDTDKTEENDRKSKEMS